MLSVVLCYSSFGVVIHPRVTSMSLPGSLPTLGGEAREGAVCSKQTAGAF